MYQEDWEKKNLFQKSWKKSPSRPFLAHPAGGQETTFYLRVAPVLGGNRARASLQVQACCWVLSTQDPVIVN